MTAGEEVCGRRPERCTGGVLIVNKRSASSLVRAAMATGLCAVLLLLPVSDASAQAAEEASVKRVVERFLAALGEGDLEALPGMFAPGASIGTASLRDGAWVTSTLSFEAWLATLRQRTTWRRFREPVSEFTVHIEDGPMAFVRADATVIVDDRAVSHNIDFFTLVQADGTWKFLSASYIARPLQTE